MAEFIPEIEQYYMLSKNNLKEFSSTLAKSFKEYPLFEYFSNGMYSIEKMTYFWSVSIKAATGNLICFSDDVNINAVAMFSPNGLKDSSFWAYVSAGGLSLIRKFGLRSVMKMMSFEEFAGKIKRKYALNDCWYLYTLAVLPEARHKGHGSKLLRPILTYLDRIKRDCYVETLKIENVALYEHFGFKLMESIRIPGTNMIIYAMHRKV